MVFYGRVHEFKVKGLLFNVWPVDNDRRDSTLHLNLKGFGPGVLVVVENVLIVGVFAFKELMVVFRVQVVLTLLIDVDLG